MFVLLLLTRTVSAEPSLKLERIESRLSGFSQDGHGYQSQAGLPTGAERDRNAPSGQGSERLTVFQPQLRAVFSQGTRLEYSLWLPVDFVTSASPDAVDVTTGASRHERANTVDLATTYKANDHDTLGVRGGFHLEEHLRSWNIGQSYARSFAMNNATAAASANVVLDAFERRKTDGGLNGRASRATANANVSFTQVVSPDTVVYVDYGITRQQGELATNWNVVPFRFGGYVSEIAPRDRLRHSVVVRGAQWLPWRGALKGYYRFYRDDWGVLAHTAELQLAQRFSSLFWMHGDVRYHHQTGVGFFTTSARDLSSVRTADSDLARFSAVTVGGTIVVDVPWHPFGAMRFEAGYARYSRSNDLTMHLATIGTDIVFD